MRAADALANAAKRVSAADFALFAADPEHAYAVLGATLGKGRQHLAEMLRVYEAQTGVTLAELAQVLDIVVQQYLPAPWSA